MDIPRTALSDHDLLIVIDTKLGFLAASVKDLDEKFKTKADQTDLNAIEARLDAMERKYWIGAGAVLALQVALTLFFKALPLLTWVR